MVYPFTDSHPNTNPAVQGSELSSQPTDHESNTLTITPPSYTDIYFYSICRRQGSTFNPRLSVSLHRLERSVFIY